MHRVYCTLGCELGFLCVELCLAKWVIEFGTGTWNRASSWDILKGRSSLRDRGECVCFIVHWQYSSEVDVFVVEGVAAASDGGWE
jgi:hypothetical protein